MSTTTTNKMPAPVYAVAGASDLAFQQLLKLPSVTAELRDEIPARVAELRNELPGRVAELRVDFPARVDRLRTELPGRVAELRNEIPAAVNTFVAEAVQVYADLVKRGEK